MAKIKNCKDCKFYDVSSEIMEAICILLDQPIEVDTAPPYEKVIVPQKDCPVNTGRGITQGRHTSHGQTGE